MIVAIAPWSHPVEVKEASFEVAELQSVWAAPDTPIEDIALPWDIIAFDNRDLTGGRWEFSVYCSVVEFCWRSEWPRLTSRSSGPGHTGDLS